MRRKDFLCPIYAAIRSTSFRRLIFMVLFSAAVQTSLTAAPPQKLERSSIPRSHNDEELTRFASGASPAAHQYAIQNGAEIRPTKDGKSFFLIWYPDKSAAEKPAVLVSLHGHGGFAFQEFFLWHETLKARGLGMIALQWWLGGSEKTEDYLSPQEMYRAIDQVLHQEKILPGNVLFHGFSRGAANTYAVTALDVHSGNHFFGMTIANSGGASENYPPNHAVASGVFGKMPFSGTRWVLFAGALDENPDRDGIPAMLRTAEWVKKFGGEIVEVIQDPKSGHGGFMLNPANMNHALDLFDEIKK